MKLSYIDNFIHRLSIFIGQSIKISINTNKRVFITFNPKTQKMSLHQIFLKAPDYILEALHDFINEKNDVLSKKLLKNYIQNHNKFFSFQNELSYQRKISTQTTGIFYDLNNIYKSLNKKYFNNHVNAKISWFGKFCKSTTTSRILGRFFSDFKLIQIHKCLDHKKVPEFFVEYVVYHEMLHYFFPVTINPKGRRIVHSSSFKEQERCFEKYLDARLWEKKNKHMLFN